MRETYYTHQDRLAASLTIHEAIKLLDEGHRITHIDFTKSEYLYKFDGSIIGEDGCVFDEEMERRLNDPRWHKGWDIYIESAT